jgi:hypothetical protein
MVVLQNINSLRREAERAHPIVMASLRKQPMNHCRIFSDLGVAR